MIDKSNHRVTVDREYLEMLEEEYGKSKENNKNAVVKVAKVEGNDTIFLSGIDVVMSNRPSNEIIVVNNEGKELGRYIRIDG
jgi:hypothetical protein